MKNGLKTVFIIIVSILAIYAVVGLGIYAHMRSSIHPLNAQNIYNLVNTHRKSIGLKALYWDERACELASSRIDKVTKAADHIDWNKDADKWQEKYPFTVSENWVEAINDSIALEVWLKSEPHRKAIEDIKYTSTCVVAKGDAALQVFAIIK